MVKSQALQGAPVVCDSPSLSGPDLRSPQPARSRKRKTKQKPRKKQYLP